MNPAVKRGFEFTHKRMLDVHWKPGPGQTYRDAPKARMVVTRATRATVWYGYAGDEGPGGWGMDRVNFEAQYAGG